MRVGRRGKTVQELGQNYKVDEEMGRNYKAIFEKTGQEREWSSNEQVVVEKHKEMYENMVSELG